MTEEQERMIRIPACREIDEKVIRTVKRCLRVNILRDDLSDEEIHHLELMYDLLEFHDLELAPPKNWKELLTRPLKFLDEALNSGDGVYRP